MDFLKKEINTNQGFGVIHKTPSLKKRREDCSIDSNEVISPLKTPEVKRFKQ